MPINGKWSPDELEKDDAESIWEVHWEGIRIFFLTEGGHEAILSWLPGEQSVGRNDNGSCH